MEKSHGIKTSLSYQVYDKDNLILSNDLGNSEITGYIDFENLKTGKKKRIPFRSFVDNFIQIIHGILSGDSGADTVLQSVSYAATNASVASRGLLAGTDSYPVIINDSSITKLSSVSLYYYAHSFTPPSYSGYTSQFAISRLIVNNGLNTKYAEEVGLYTAASPTTTRRLITRDLNSFAITTEEATRITFTFNSTMDGYGGATLNFVKLIYNWIIKGNINDSSSRIVSRTGTYPTYASNAGTSGDFYVGGGTDTYFGIVLHNDLVKTDKFSPGTNAMAPDHTGFSVGANSISAIEYVSITNGAQFIISRNFLNTSNSTINVSRIGLLTKGDSTNAGTTLHTDQVLLIINEPSTNIPVAPNQTLKITYKIGIQA